MSLRPFKRPRLLDKIEAQAQVAPKKISKAKPAKKVDKKISKKKK